MSVKAGQAQTRRTRACHATWYCVLVLRRVGVRLDSETPPIQIGNATIGTQPPRPLPSPPPASDRVCARCGLARPPATTWPEGPVCDPCSTAALRRRGPCSGCGRQRRLVAPPGPTAITCADCSDQTEIRR